MILTSGLNQCIRCILEMKTCIQYQSISPKSKQHLRTVAVNGQGLFTTLFSYIIDFSKKFSYLETKIGLIYFCKRNYAPLTIIKVKKVFCFMAIFGASLTGVSGNYLIYSIFSSHRRAL